jgi:hypothetical protein
LPRAGLQDLAGDADVNLRHRLLRTTDRLTSVGLVSLVAGTTVAFGGRVWWAPPAIAALCLTLAVLGLVRMLLEGSVRVLKSPLTALGLLALVLAVGQLAPLPGGLSARLSPSSRAAYALGFLPDRARALDPDVPLPDAAEIRSPVTVDRPATLRWLAGGAACLAVFWAVARYADRLGHLYVVWGSVVGAFFLNSAVALVQFACGCSSRAGQGAFSATSSRAAARRGRRPGSICWRVRGRPSSAPPAVRGLATPPGRCRFPTGRCCWAARWEDRGRISRWPRSGCRWPWR